MPSSTAEPTFSESCASESMYIPEVPGCASVCGAMALPSRVVPDSTWAVEMLLFRSEGNRLHIQHAPARTRFRVRLAIGGSRPRVGPGYLGMQIESHMAAWRGRSLQTDTRRSADDAQPRVFQEVSRPESVAVGVGVVRSARLYRYLHGQRGCMAGSCNLFGVEQNGPLGQSRVVLHPTVGRVVACGR
jgi:hypothetical protein